MAKVKSIQAIALDFLERRNDETFRKVISRMKPGLLSHTYRYVQDPELSKEIVAKTFIAVWEKIHQYNSEFNFSTWVYAIAKNEALGQLRIKKKFLSHNTLTDNNSSMLKSYNPVVNMDIEIYGPVGEEITYHLYDKVVDVINKLDEPYRSVITEREVNQKSLQDIANKLGWNLSTVKTRLRKARTDVAKLVKEKHPTLLEDYYEKQNS